MSWVEFEPTIPASERAKTVHALDHAATGIGIQQLKYHLKIKEEWRHRQNTYTHKQGEDKAKIIIWQLQI
jgi:hypothetical protein